MNTKLILAVLLMLCGAALTPSAYAAEYFCRVYSGTDTWVKSTVNNGHYKSTGADKAATEKAVLAKTAKARPDANLTSARCELAVADFNTASATSAPAAAAAAAPAPAAGGSTFYCVVYKEDGSQISPPADKAAEHNAWKVPSASLAASESDAVTLAKASAAGDADSAICGSSMEKLMNSF